MDIFKGPGNFATLVVDDALIVDQGNMIFVRDTDLLLDVLKTLSTKKIVGAPVVSSVNGQDQFLGFIDSLDAAAWIAGKKADIGDIASVNVPCKEALSAQNRILFVKPSSKMSEAIETMVQNKVHRLAVVDEKYDGPREVPMPFKSILSIVTQSDIFSLMVTYTYTLVDSSRFNQSMAELKIEMPRVETCNLTDLTSDAFTKMQSQRFSALGVVDGTGKLVNYLGATHLKGLNKANLWDLYLPVGKFLETRQASFEAFPRSKKLRDIISAAKDSRYHRTFFVDDQGKPVGVLTLRDFLELIVLKLRLFD